MLKRGLLLFCALLLTACGGSSVERPAQSAPNAPEASPEPAATTMGAPTPLSPASWRAPENPAAFELLTTPGEVPFLRLATDAAESGRLPLEHTHVNAALHGLVAEVEVTQTYKNPHPEPIEVVYVFPLPENSAVNFMQMRIGDRKITAEIDERERARRRYVEAKRQGHTAALLEQERPNVFTQSVANIAPGEAIDVVLRYVQDLSYDRGEYEFVFPMVVGPRFMPGAPSQGAEGTGTEPNTTGVPDAARISPPYVGKGERSGHDISLTLVADAGHPIAEFRAVTHKVAAKPRGDGRLSVTLSEGTSIPNRDFVLRYRAVAERPQAAFYFSKAQADAGYFSLVIEPPQLDVEHLVGRREVVFVVDVSGSMAGTPLSLCRSAMRLALERLRPQDTFNIITFAGHTTRAFPSSQPANRSNIQRALRIVSELSAGGGTQMADAIDAALAPSAAHGRHRYVFFMTDGYVGNEQEILDKSRSFVRDFEEQGVRAKVFGFGVGSSPNRYLVSGLSQAGKGVSVYATEQEDPNRAVNQFYHYIDRAVLTNVRIDWVGVDTSQVYPQEIPDLFASHPLVLHGRFSGDPKRPLRVLATAGDRPITLPVEVEPATTNGKASQALGALWARARVDRLEQALLDGSLPDAQRRITELGLGFNLVTRFTSFVAIDSSRRVGRGAPQQIVQPSERPQGVDLDMAGRSEPRSGRQRAVEFEGASRAPAQPSGAVPDDAAAGDAELEAGDAGEAQEEAGDLIDLDEEARQYPTPAADGSAPMTGQVANQAVEPKRGCGCRLVGDPSAGGFGLGVLGLGLWWARRRRQRGRAALRPQA